LSEDSRPTTILLIDGAPHVREVLCIALESEGDRVIEAADSREGVALVREHRPAVTIVDIIMPEKDGIETVREILAIDPAAVVFTLSRADDDYQEVARMLGAKRGFRKPVVGRSLENVLAVTRARGERPCQSRFQRWLDSGTTLRP
jgi:DNA-binding response OmpR family regulator